MVLRGSERRLTAVDATYLAPQPGPALGGDETRSEINMVERLHIPAPETREGFLGLNDDLKRAVKTRCRDLIEAELRRVGETAATGKKAKAARLDRIDVPEQGRAIEMRYRFAAGDGKLMLEIESIDVVSAAQAV